MKIRDGNSLAERSSAANSAPAERSQVIVIDDDRLFAQMARAVLHRFGFTSVIASTARDGVRAARDNPHALLLIDYHLDDRDAPAVLEALETTPPFIVITGDGESRLAVEMMKLGARDFIVKDRTFLEVLPHVVGRVLGQLEREASFARREARLASIFEASADAMLIAEVDDVGRFVGFVDVNGSATRYAGRARDVLMRTPLSAILPRLSASLLRRACRRALDGELVSIETSLAQPAGELPVELTLQRLAGADDESHVLLMARDISERQHAAAERRLLAIAIEQSDEAVMITDPEGHIEYTNSAFERITGYAREQVRGQTPRVLQSGEQDAEFYAALWGAICAGETWHGRMINRRKDGSRYEQQAVISPVRDAHGEIAHFVAVARDVTREVQLQQQLLQSQKMDAVGKLAGGIAHDFNNLLLVMQSASESLLDSLDTRSPSRADARDIFEAARSAKRLTRKLLAFSRRQPLQSKRRDLRHLLGEMQRILRRLVRADIQLEVTACSDAAFAVVDASQFEQVVVNLVLNARDAIATSGSIEIALEHAELDETSFDTLVEPAAGEAGKYVRLRVHDDGCGMSEAARARACEPFFTTKGPSHGTGLGLATVYGIVRQHGGHLGIDSRLGHGTTISVYLPLAPSVAARASAMSGARVATPSAPIAKLPTLDTGEPLARGKSTLEAPAVTPPANDNDRATRHKLLLVEDEPLVRKATARMLTRLGYEVITAENGVEALALCREGADFAVVVSDVVMPQMGGPQLANALQGLERAPKVLLVSGHTGDDACSADKLPRGVALMSKPFRRAQIEQMLRQLLSTDMCHTSAVDLAHAVTAAAPDLAQN